MALHRGSNAIGAGYPMGGLAIGTKRRGESRGIDFGQGHYFEVVPSNISGGETRIGIMSGSIISDGQTFGNEGGANAIAMRPDGAVYWHNSGQVPSNVGGGVSFTDGDVVSVMVRGGFIWFAVNGVLGASGRSVAGGLQGTWYPAASMYQVTGTASVTARFAESSFTYSPPEGFRGIGDNAVWLDENSVVLSGGDLTASKGTVADFTPVRANTGFTAMPANLVAAITLPTTL